MIETTSVVAGRSAPEPLQIGVAALDRSGDGASRKEAAKELVAQALGLVDTDQLPVRWVLLLATADWCKEPPTLPKEVRRALKHALGYDVPLIGGSMARLFCSAAPKYFVEHGVAIMVLASEDFWGTVTSLAEPHRTSDTERRERVQQMAKDLEDAAGTRLGASADRHLLGIFPGILLNERREQVYYDNELHEEILAAFGHRYRLIGGAAADDLAPTVGYQFANDDCLKSGLALGLIETDLAWGTMMGHGLAPNRNIHVSVDALKDGADTGYEVTLLDGKPAGERIEELKREAPPRCGQLLFGLAIGPDYYIVSALHQEKGPRGFVSLNRRVSLGDRLFLLDATAAQIANVARGTIDAAIRNSETTVPNVRLLWGLSCTGRFQIARALQLKWQNAVRKLDKSYPRDVPLVGGLSAGEFGVDRWQRAQANNFSFWVSCVASSRSPRAASRRLQTALLAAAECLSNCQAPRQVMEVALDRALAAGATGGQVCLVDYAIGRILGLGIGHSAQSPGQPHNWSEVAKRTDRPASKEPGGEFPRDLLNWSKPVRQDLPLRIVPAIETEEDILTLVVRTLRAVLVHDIHDPMFHCNIEAGDAGKIVTFLAIPLIGSNGKAIATLELGFPDHSVIDRESFGLWVGYGQKVAAALERAQEAQERTMLERISAIGNRIMQSPLDPQKTVYHWCDEFLNEVVSLLGATGAHIRVLSMPPSGKEEYRLVSAVGHLAKLRFLTRPVTRTQHGSCNLRLLKAGGQLTLTKMQTAGLNRNVRAIEKTGQHGQDFRRELGTIESTALLPLRHHDKILGSFVLESQQSYFFTERTARVVRTAAELAGAILCGKIADSEFLRLDNERALMLETLVSATEGTAEERLRRVVKYLCSALEADAGSVFVWHENIGKLVLHTAHNWYRPMEGQARYEVGEGWTGGLVTRQERVSFVSPGISEGANCTRKYYDCIVPPNNRFSGYQPDARIGVKLMAGSVLIGVVHFTYYRQHALRLSADSTPKLKLLDVLQHLITLSVEAARREATEREARRLLSVKNEVVRLLFNITEREAWTQVMEALRKGFAVSRASFYPIRSERVESGWTATSQDWPHTVRSFDSMEPLGVLREVVVGGRDITLTCANDEGLAGWPNHEGVNALYAVPVFSSLGAVAGVLEFANRIPDRDHPFDCFDGYERSAVVEVARSLSTALDRQNAIIELRNQLEIANRIGATSLASAIVMHRMMSPVARLRSSLDWLDLHPGCSKDDLAQHLARMKADCSEAIETIQQAALGALRRQRADLRNLLNQAMRAVIPHLANAKVKLDASNELRLRVEVDVFSLVGALVNLLTNAIDASAAGAVVTVTTERTPDDKEAIVRIHNPGRKYTPQELADFLTPGRTTKVSPGHLGLGLAISRRAVEASGGSLILSSPDSEGVEARVTLPLVLEQIRPPTT